MGGSGFPWAAVVLGAAGVLAAATLGVFAATGVAPVPASVPARRAAAELLARAGGALDGKRVYDLGCGFGSLLCHLAAAFPSARFVGIEVSPLPYAIARLRSLRHRNVEVRFANFFGVPVGDAGAVLCYLMLRPMRRLAAKLDAELAAGTPVVALGFLFRGRRFEEMRRVPGLFPMDVALYRWEPRALTGPPGGDTSAV